MRLLCGVKPTAAGQQQRMFVIVMAKGAAKYQTFLWHVSRCWIYGLISPLFSLSCHRGGNEAEVQCVVRLSWTASMRHFRLLTEKKNGLSKVRLTDIFHVLKHNEEICSAAEAPPGATLNIKKERLHFKCCRRINRLLQWPEKTKEKFLTQKGNV